MFGNLILNKLEEESKTEIKEQLNDIYYKLQQIEENLEEVKEQFLNIYR